MSRFGLISQHHRSALRNPWVLGMLTLVIVVLLVNAAFIWLANHDQSTLVDREYKTRDRKTGAEFLSGLGARQALAWKVSINRPKAIVRSEPTLYDISVVDSEGKPVRGELVVEAYRAADAAKDFTTRFAEVSIGNYQGLIAFPLKGYWELHIRVSRGDEIFSVQTERFMVAETH
jgi:nitrogen fixation protein FixH